MTHDPRHDGTLSDGRLPDGRLPDGTLPDGSLSDAMRFELRALRQDVAPANDLWPSIAARIAATPQVAPAPPRRGWRPLLPLAAAATLALAVGIAWQVRPPATPAAVPPANDPHHQLIAREADAMTREYQAALKEIDALAPPEAKAAPALQVLDRSAAQIRVALSRDPNARFLLNRLQSTYTRRLELTQRLARTSLAS